MFWLLLSQHLTPDGFRGALISASGVPRGGNRFEHPRLAGGGVSNSAQMCDGHCLCDFALHKVCNSKMVDTAHLNAAIILVTTVGIQIGP